MINRTYGGSASGSILRIAIGISLLVILLPGLANAQDTSPPNYITQWGSLGNGDGQFNFPTSVAVDSSGNVYVADADNYRIQKFSSTGTFITKWGSKGSGYGQFNLPRGIAVDSSGSVYVIDGSNHNIQKFSSTGTFITKWGSRGSGDGQLKMPYGIAVDSSRNVYVTDENHRIQKFTSTGTFITKWGSVPWGTGDGEFKTPIGIAVDSSGNVYVADMENHRIQKFSSTGTFITKWGSDGNEDGQFANPSGVAVDSSGNVYVADYGNDRIQKFSNTGGFITKWGSAGSGDGQFDFDYSNNIAVDSSGNVYVADTGNNRIQKFGNLAIPTNPTLTVDKVWTMDGNNKDKSSFAPGDPIRFGVTVKNDGSSTIKGVFTLQVTDPKNVVLVQMGETPKDFAPGLTTFGIGYDPGIIPKDAPAGTYTLTVTVSYNGQSSSKQSQFTVQAPPTPPTPTPTLTEGIGEISGTVFDDFNGDGIKNPDGSKGEPGLKKWTINLIRKTDGLSFKNITDEYGHYVFKNLPAGEYTIQEIVNKGWVLTFPVSAIPGKMPEYTVKIPDERLCTVCLDSIIKGKDFGNNLDVEKQKKKKFPNTFYSGIRWKSGAIDVSQQAWAFDAKLIETYKDTDKIFCGIRINPLDDCYNGLYGMYDVYMAYNNIPTKKNHLSDKNGDGYHKIVFSHSGGTQILLKKLQSKKVTADYAVFIAPALISKEEIEDLVNKKQVKKKVIIVESTKDLLYNINAEFELNHEFVTPGDADVPSTSYYEPAVTFHNVPPDGFGFNLDTLIKFMGRTWNVVDFLDDNKIDHKDKRLQNDIFWAGGADRIEHKLFNDVFKETGNVIVVDMEGKDDFGEDFDKMTSDDIHHELLVRTIEMYQNGIKPFDGIDGRPKKAG